MSKTEMKKVLKTKGADVRTRLLTGGWKDFFGELDKDGDGAIECEELVDFYVRKLSICGCGNSASSAAGESTGGANVSAPTEAPTKVAAAVEAKEAMVLG